MCARTSIACSDVMSSFLLRNQGVTRVKRLHNSRQSHPRRACPATGTHAQLKMFKGNRQNRRAPWLRLVARISSIVSPTCAALPEHPLFQAGFIFEGWTRIRREGGTSSCSNDCAISFLDRTMNTAKTSTLHRVHRVQSHHQARVAATPLYPRLPLKPYARLAA